MIVVLPLLSGQAVSPLSISISDRDHLVHYIIVLSVLNKEESPNNSMTIGQLIDQPFHDEKIMKEKRRIMTKMSQFHAFCSWILIAGPQSDGPGKSRGLAGQILPFQSNSRLVTSMTSSLFSEASIRDFARRANTKKGISTRSNTKGKELKYRPSNEHSILPAASKFPVC